MRELTKDILPDYILNNKNKLGFSTPFKKWMNSGPLHTLAYDVIGMLHKSELSNFLKPKDILNFLEGCHEMFIWQLLNALLWEQEIIDYRKNTVAFI